MVKNPEKLQKFETELIRKQKVDITQNFRLLDSMYEEAVALGVLPLKDALDGLEVDIRIAKVVNSVSKSP